MKKLIILLAIIVTSCTEAQEYNGRVKNPEEPPASKEVELLACGVNHNQWEIIKDGGYWMEYHYKQTYDFEKETSYFSFLFPLKIHVNYFITPQNSGFGQVFTISYRDVPNTNNWQKKDSLTYTFSDKQIDFYYFNFTNSSSPPDITFVVWKKL